ARCLSGSYDNTIRVWDAHTGKMIGEPLMGHISAVMSVAYSSDGTRIVSGSADTTIRVWDAHTGKMIGEPLIRDVARASRTREYSPRAPDGDFGAGFPRASAGIAGNARPTCLPLMGHTSVVTSVAYLSDGTRIVSGSADNTIRV
ncbi:WD40 repeat-like protein, partial [Ceratobasidium sp. AG-I]